MTLSHLKISNIGIMKNVYKFIVFIFLISAVFIRYDLLNKHFSHVDDFLPIQTYQLLFSDSALMGKINKKLHTQNWNKEIKNKFNPLVYSGYIIFASTYAPVQFVFTYFTLNNFLDYKSTLFWARFPSFIFSLLSFILLYFLYQIHLKNGNYIFLIGLMLLCFSWEFIIYSVQSETYAIGIFSYLLIFLMFFNLLKTFNELKQREVFYYGIVFSILVFTQYQVIFILPVVFLLLLIENRRNFKANIIKLIIVSVPSLFTTILLYFLVLRRLTNAGVMWNAGPNNEFLYSIHGMNFISALKYSFSFFINNSFLTFESLIGFGNQSLVLNKIITFFYLICLIVGLFSMFFSTSKLKRYFIYMTLITGSFFFILILINKLTLSPTRHSLIYLSFIAIILPHGFISILNIIKLLSLKVKNAVILIFCSCIFCIFLFQFSSIKDSRIDKFNTSEIEMLIKKYKITDIYSLNWTWNLLFMNFIKSSYSHELNNTSLHFYPKQISTNNNILIISHREIDSTTIANDFYAKQVDLNKYKILYKKEVRSSTEICFSNLTKNGTNGLYVFIYGRK